LSKRTSVLVLLYCTSFSPILSTMSDFSVIKSLGAGSMGQVNLVKNEKGERFALKVLDKAQSEFSAQNVKREIEAGKIAKDHAGISAPFKSWEDMENVYLLMDYIEGLDLITMLENQDGEPFSEDAAREIFKQLLSALTYLHENGIAHRDLKLDNMMLDSKGNLKIIDFGLCETDGAVKCRDRVGSIEYCAPEIYDDAPYNGYTSDIWSSGVVLYALLFGCFPYTPDDCDDLCNGMEVSVIFPRCFDVSSEAKDLIKRMLQAKPEKRISLEEIKKNDWVHSASATTACQ